MREDTGQVYSHQDGSIVEENPHVKALYGVPSERGGTTWLEECPDYIKAPSYGTGHAILARYKEARTGPAKRLLNLCSITIQSPALKDVIRQVFKDYPGEAVDEYEPTFEAPFHAFVHRWATLRCACSASKQQGESQRAEQIEALLGVLMEELGDDLRDAKTLADNSTIVFRHLWMFYPPGCPVLGEWQGQKHCFIVNEAKYLMAEMPPMMALDLLLLDHDGERFGWRKVRKFIPGYEGSMPISTLPAIPVFFHDDPEQVISRLSDRGKSATKYLHGSPVYKGYEGAVRLQRSFDMEEVEVFVDGRIIIDAKSHSQHASRYCPAVFTVPHRLECLLVRDPHTKLVSIERTGEKRGGLLTAMENLNSHPVLGIGPYRLHYLEPSLARDDATSSPLLKRHRWTEVLFGIPPEAFCRSAVRGYCLVSKAWAEFEIDNVTDIQWNMGAFDALVMSPARKRLLEALVRQQQAHKADADVDDVVKGKGQGLIMLLTGPPGTGKTLTAESIADRLRLPLYACSASELGDTAKDIESQFGQVLRLAASWNAVLLLDEADAFLDRRVDSPEARERNKRVAGGFITSRGRLVRG